VTGRLLHRLLVIACQMMELGLHLTQDELELRIQARLALHDVLLVLLLLLPLLLLELIVAKLIVVPLLLPLLLLPLLLLPLLLLQLLLLHKVSALWVVHLLVRRHQVPPPADHPATSLGLTVPARL
jgi:hypothetical protein